MENKMGARLRRLVPYLVPYRHLFILGILSLIITDCISLTIPWLTKQALDLLSTRSREGGALLRYPVLILLAACSQAILRYYWRTRLYGFARHGEWKLRNTVFSHLQKLPLSYFQHARTGDLMSRVTSDLGSVREMVGVGALVTIDAAILISTSLPLMILIDPSLTFWSLLSLPGITVLVFIFKRLISVRHREIQRQLAEMSGFVQEGLSGIRVIKAYCQEENQKKRFDTLSRGYMVSHMNLTLLSGFFWPLLSFLSGIAATVVLWVGGQKVLNGGLTLGQFVAFNGYLGLLTWPLQAIGNLVNLYQRGTVALGRLLEILDTPVAPGYEADGSAGEPAPLAGEIEFRDCSFRYSPQGPWILNGVSFRVPAGHFCGIVGETGSGKSTLVNLLLRLFEAPEGTLFIDGVPLHRLPVSHLRRSIGFLSQEASLFSDTIEENIRFGLHEASHARVVGAAAGARVLPAIMEFTEGFETQLGERGVRLSGGQRQRIALARALIKAPPILILDDPFSNIDTKTTEEILSTLLGVIRGRTTLLVSHRLAAVRHADLILYLKGGRIIEQGTHEELIALGGEYARLYTKQCLEQEIDGIRRNEEPA